MSRDYYLFKSRGLSIADLKNNDNLKDIKITQHGKDSYWLTDDDAELLAVCLEDIDEENNNDVNPIYFFTAFIGRKGEKILKRIAKAFDGVEFIDDERIEFIHNEENILVEELMKKILNE